MAQFGRSRRAGCRTPPVTVAGMRCGCGSQSMPYFSDFAGWPWCLALSKCQHPTQMSCQTFPERHILRRVPAQAQRKPPHRAVSAVSHSLDCYGSFQGKADLAAPTDGERVPCVTSAVLSIGRCTTVREMKEGPSRPAVRCWSQATASCDCQKQWWFAKSGHRLPRAAILTPLRKGRADLLLCNRRSTSPA
jgi:hypothetical protein